MTSEKLRGKTVVITGASSGVGRAAALAFAAQGANLLLVSRRQAVLDRLAQECCAHGIVAHGWTADVGDAQAMQEAARRAHERDGRIDVWISNAGVGAVGEFTQTPIAAHERVIRTNLVGCMNGAYAVLPYFQQQRFGVLINTLSVGSWVPAPYAVAYSASKFGLRGFSEALRGELERFPGIHVCDVFPGFLDTPGFAHGANYLGREIKPLPPLYDARRVAQAMVGLAAHPAEAAVTVGAGATAARLTHALAPRLTSRAFARAVEYHHRHARPAPRSDGALFESTSEDSAIDGGYRRAAPSKAVPAGALLAGALLGWYFARGR